MPRTLAVNRALASTRTLVPAFDLSYALQFNGSTQSATRSSDTSQTVNNFTYSCWFYIISLPSVSGFMFSNGNATANGVGLNIDNTGLFRATYHSVVNGSSGQTLLLNTWYQGGVRRLNGTSQIFLNGLPVGSTFANAPNQPNAAISIGARVSSGTPGSFLNAIVDDCRIYERPLQNSEMLALGNQNPVGSTDLKVHYKLNEGTGSTSVDSSGNGFTLTLNNTPTWVTGNVRESGRGLSGLRTLIT